MYKIYMKTCVNWDVFSPVVLVCLVAQVPVIVLFNYTHNHQLCSLLLTLI